MSSHSPQQVWSTAARQWLRRPRNRWYRGWTPTGRRTWLWLFRRCRRYYVVKPFSPTELAARIRAALRRQAVPALDAPSEPYLLGGLTVDYAQRMVTVAGSPVDLTDIEYRMLVELSANAGRIMTHEQLIRRVWGQDKLTNSGPVRAIVKRLRRKLGDDVDDPAYIFTKRRVGYWMEKGEALEREGP